MSTFKTKIETTVGRVPQSLDSNYKVTVKFSSDENLTKEQQITRAINKLRTYRRTLHNGGK